MLYFGDYSATRSMTGGIEECRLICSSIASAAFGPQTTYVRWSDNSLHVAKIIDSNSMATHNPFVSIVVEYISRMNANNESVRSFVIVICKANLCNLRAPPQRWLTLQHFFAHFSLVTTYIASQTSSFNASSKQ